MTANIESLRLQVSNLAIAIAFNVGDPERVRAEFDRAAREYGDAIEEKVLLAKIEAGRERVTVEKRPVVVCGTGGEGC
jgi:hypothetical protein